MAGGGDQADNPVAINVVPMVDVIFCLCVFFMCSFKFKQLEGNWRSLNDLIRNTNFKANVVIDLLDVS